MICYTCVTVRRGPAHWLPDGWGLILMSRAMRQAGLDFHATSALDRLSFIGRRGMGALVYEPESSTLQEQDELVELAVLAAEVDRVLAGSSEDILTELLVLGGSPGGVRPKILVGVRQSPGGDEMVSGVADLPNGFEHWLVKFNNAEEDPEASVIEFIYAETARHVGLDMSPSKLFKDSSGRLWFGTKRFDRGPGNARLHMHTAAGLVHANFCLPALDYADLLKITIALTRRASDLEAAFRLAAFNVVFHNRDDHAKNFAFTMSESGSWRLSPAYDLTYSNGPGGEHTTSVMGEGKAANVDHLRKLGMSAGMKKQVCEAILEEVDNGRAFMKLELRKCGIKHREIFKVLERSIAQRNT